MAKALTLTLSAGAILTLFSTALGARSAPATYADIMGCETICLVAAAGWPLVFVRDYPGMSVGHRATLFDAAFSADRFDGPPFLLDMLFWSGWAWLAARIAKKGRG